VAEEGKVLDIGGRMVGPGHPCLIIAEVAQAHDGSLGQAHRYIDAAARAGVDAVKFQTHIAHAESTPAETFRVPFSRQDASRYDYWKRMEFSADQWGELSAHAREAGLLFLSSAFSEEAVDLLSRVGMPAWKVGSGEVTNTPLIAYMASKGQPVLLSSGMSSWEDLDAAVATVRQAGVDVGVMQCTTSYPCPPEKVGLNVLDELRTRYGAPVGLSDHSARVETGLAAVALGASMLEFHVVFSRDSFGPDTSSSLTIDQTAQLVEGVRYIECMRDHPVDKGAIASSLHELKTLFGKSVVAATDLKQGHRLDRTDLALKKPGGGIPPAALSEVLGRTLARDVAEDTALGEEDLV
jgi:N-acetylneuraminate synthase